MIVLSEAVVLALKTTSRGEFPVIGWENLVTVDNVSATSSLAGYPASNLANPSTTPLQGWRSNSASVQYVTVDLLAVADDEVDYLAVARHNFGSKQIEVSVETLSAEEDADWVEAVEPFLLPNDAPFLARFVLDNQIGVRLKLDPTTSAEPTAPQAAVLHVGRLLEFRNGVLAGSTVLQFGRERDIATKLSRSGEFLGRIIRGGKRRGQASFRNIDPTFYRTKVDPFVEASAEVPFFWVPDPKFKPQEVGFAWLANEPSPATQAGGYFDLTLDLEGIL